MNAVTEIAYIALPKAEVFDFLANVENLPLWATAFCESGRWDGDLFKVSTRWGEMVVRLESDSRTGVVDRWTRLDGAQEWTVLPLRIFDVRVGYSAVCVTCFQRPGQSDELFYLHHRSLQMDFHKLTEVVTDKLLKW